MGKWYCECQWDPEEVEEASEDDSWKSYRSEFSGGWEADTEEEMEQDEGLVTPAEKQSLTVSISPDDATATAQAAKRALYNLRSVAFNL